MLDFSKEELIHPWIWLYECMSARYSRLSFGCVLWCGNDVSGIGKLWRSCPCHDREHGRSTSAARSIQGHHAQQVLSILLEHQPCGHHLACLFVHCKATVTTYREIKRYYSWYFSTNSSSLLAWILIQTVSQLKKVILSFWAKANKPWRVFLFFIISFQLSLKGYISLWSCDIWITFVTNIFK